MGAARHLGLFSLLGRFLKRKRLQRGASDVENLGSLIASLACADGKFPDQDWLKGSRANRGLLGLSEVAGSPRIGEWLGKLTRRHADSLRGIASRLAALASRPQMHVADSSAGHPFFTCSCLREKVSRHGNPQSTVQPRRVLIFHPNLHLVSSKVTADNGRVPIDSETHGRNQ